MYTLIGYSAGIMMEAVLLMTGVDRMRAVVAGFPDTLELRHIDSRWITEKGEVVEFEFMLSAATEAITLSKTCSNQGADQSPALAVRTAGSGLPD